jgi:hypothetical protein
MTIDINIYRGKISIWIHRVCVCVYEYRVICLELSNAHIYWKLLKKQKLRLREKILGDVSRGYYVQKNRRTSFDNSHHSLLRPFRVTAGNAALDANPI